MKNYNEEEKEWLEKSFHKKYAVNKVGIGTDKLDNEVDITNIKYSIDMDKIHHYKNGELEEEEYDDQEGGDIIKLKTMKICPRGTSKHGVVVSQRNVCV